MKKLILLIAILLLVGCNMGKCGGSSSPAPPPPEDPPVIIDPVDPATQPLVWGESAWGEGKWK